ncbi:pyruvate dehydrogenase complex dihydrolipoyllysine-residue acetyltransferase [Agarilytica rhodophyticola]|uniref:pyruvate dehydrogenase complex dihydrolipoyllysine-residue acetyltransferase n=1 Tax=Agarilytica rhodophyticola TaxID=1737490 RepID=UPI000B344A75|nr:pyruvate dehydrogenase complex dihydrolipoyllysine-residue acetyltransferase [Agarilytica rhodophyticola]
MAKQTVPVPDIGGAENVDVIEISVAPGDVIAVDDPLITLESDKASMDIPSPVAGKVINVLVKEGDQVSEGSAVLEIEVGGAEDAAPATQAAPVESAPAAASSATEQTPVAVPDIGGAEGVDVIEICVAIGDTVAEGDSIIVLESDKASMEVPAPTGGKVVSIALKEGMKVSEGDAVLVLETQGGGTVAPAPAADSAPAPVAAAPSGASASMDVSVPDIGGAEDVDVIEVCVAVGDEVSEGDSIIVLESDKASMEVPAPASGKVTKLAIKEGDKASEGTAVLTLEVAGAAPVVQEQAAPAEPEPVSAPAPAKKPAKPQTTNQLLPQDIESSGSSVYAGPAVRKLARQLGVNLGEVQATGARGRISKDDVKAFVKGVMTRKPAASAGASLTSGTGIPAIPEIDFAKFGEVETVKMSKIHKVTAANMLRSWLNVPHVTQFDDADITDMEAFRKGMKAEAEKAGVKLTPLPFLLKACAAALKHEESFNVSLHADGEHIVKKKYVHIGIAVATPNGLMVPVVKDVDKKGLFQLAEESNALAKKARDGKLMPNEMQGGCFTISSLGAIGGTGFTPIVNAPEVAILGVSKASMQPVWNGKDFTPRQMLPLSLSYDHRAINGADAGRFFTYLVSLLSDIRRLSL